MTRRKTRKSSSSPSFKDVEPKTENQKQYISLIENNSVVLCSGPSGSGKSYIAAGMSASALFRNAIDRVIITRPLVCTGKDIGSLPGELLDKIAPYLMPMQQNFRDFLGNAYYGHFYNEGRISYQPLEVMRGSTFHDSWMILDEAQNCTQEQIKMFLTRMGRNSKVLINGDTDQSDVRGDSLEYAISRLHDINGIGVCRLEKSDIQRNGLIGDILEALR